MLVGDPMSAKTKAYMLLAETLTTLAERKIPEHHEFRVNIDHPSNQQLDFLDAGAKYDHQPQVDHDGSALRLF